MTTPLSDEDLKQMPLLGHLMELRHYLIRIVGVVITIFLALLYFARDIYSWLAHPLQSMLPPHANMIATDVTSPFLTPIKLTLFMSLFIGMPFILHQIWQFVAPGLYRREKKIAIPLLLSSIVLFYIGVTFAYQLVLPAALKFFILFTPSGVLPMTSIDSYLDFCVKLFLVFGITFEIPVAVLLLVLAGIVSVDALVDKRRYIIVGCFAAAAVMTPPDAISMIMLGVPMWLLFEIGLFFARMLESRHAQTHPAD